MTTTANSIFPVMSENSQPQVPVLVSGVGSITMMSRSNKTNEVKVQNTVSDNLRPITNLQHQVGPRVILSSISQTPTTQTRLKGTQKLTDSCKLPLGGHKMHPDTNMTNITAET